LKFSYDEARKHFLCRFRLSKRFTGPPGHAHGGIIATILDEAMGKVNKIHNVIALTSEISVQYLKPVPLGKPLRVESHEVSVRGRRHINAAAILNQRGVVLDVTNAGQAEIAERAGAVSVMALERVPAQIRAEGGVARMASPKKIREIMEAVSIPVMAKCRIGHFAEAQILQELGVDYIDESEVLTPADEAHHVDKHAFKTPFVCGARNLGEALRRIAEGAAMIRTKGEAGTGDVVHAVKHIRQIVQDMKILTVLSEAELYAKAKELQAPYELVKLVAKAGKLPVP